MDPNLIAQLLANDPKTTATQSTNPQPQQPNAPPTNPPQPQTTTASQPPPPAPSSPTPSTTNNNNQLSPPCRNKYNGTFNPNYDPRYYDSDSASDSDGDDNSFLGINFGNMPGWPNNNTIMINGQDWSGIPQSQWPASVRRDHQRGMAAGARGLAEGARAMEEAAELMNGLGGVGEYLLAAATGEVE
ncbi:hypothetical protein MBLNU13_g05404t1 [Cladosporium sp. NU13]